jgi:murein DD-endopeptidase MepM/ murein hydrolase activator NlpD
MKKLIPDEKNWKSKLSRFFSSKGFYIVLAVCIIIVAATAILVTTQNINSPDVAMDQQKLIPEDAASNQVAQGDQAKEVGPAKSNTSSDVASKSPTGSAIAPKAGSGKAVTASANAVIKFIRPVTGAIFKNHTKNTDTMETSATLGDIRSHKGVDFKTEKLAKVKAVADGTISEVKCNASGITVVITHNKSLKTVYSGLSSEGLDNIAPGCAVKANEVIGLVGDPIQSECEDGPHLHFEVLKDGKSVDPTTYFQTSNNQQAK